MENDMKESFYQTFPLLKEAEQMVSKVYNSLPVEIPIILNVISTLTKINVRIIKEGNNWWVSGQRLDGDFLEYWTNFSESKQSERFLSIWILSRIFFSEKKNFTQNWSKSERIGCQAIARHLSCPAAVLEKEVQEWSDDVLLNEQTISISELGSLLLCFLEDRFDLTDRDIKYRLTEEYGLSNLKEIISLLRDPYYIPPHPSVLKKVPIRRPSSGH